MSKKNDDSTEGRSTDAARDEQKRAALRKLEERVEGVKRRLTGIAESIREFDQ